MRRRPQRLAADLHLIPYHGQPLRDPDEIYRGQAKSGTSHFHAYATVYVIHHGHRFTVALTAVAGGEPLEEVLKRLLRQAAALGVRAALLLLDRGFYSVGVIRYLQAARYPFLMPVLCRGRKADHPKGPSGTPRLPVLEAERLGALHADGAASGRTATVSIVRQVPQPARASGASTGQRLVYAFWGLQPPSLPWVKETYRQRFAIETSYRQLHQARIRTCTRRPGAAAVVWWGWR